ncbi:WD40 repeat domain protein, partial [Vibrio parahaemolyticus V-223/04]
KTSERSNFL